MRKPAEAPAGPSPSWTLDCIRNRRGEYTVQASTSDGCWEIEEPIAVAAASDRAWANPPEEIQHMRELAAWLQDRAASRCAP